MVTQGNTDLQAEVHLIRSSRVYTVRAPTQLTIVMWSLVLRNVYRSQLHALPYLRGLTLAHPMTGNKQFNVSLLIGEDYYWKLVGDDVIRGNGPTAVQSKLGYLLSGPLVQSAASNTITSMHIGININSEHGNVDQTLEKFWEVESSGTFPIMKNSDRFMDTYVSSITRQ